jgi:phage terminase Nu1 subunit (DNA packaging protein)
MPAVLNSWKEIATYLDRGVRTVQRWQHHEGLPVHHIGSGKRAPVFAFRAEIDLWLHERQDTAEQVTRATSLRSDSRRIRKETQLLIATLHTEVAKLRNTLETGIAHYESRQANKRRSVAASGKG